MRSCCIALGTLDVDVMQGYTSFYPPWRMCATAPGLTPAPVAECKCEYIYRSPPLKCMRITRSHPITETTLISSSFDLAPAVHQLERLRPRAH